MSNEQDNKCAALIPYEPQSLEERKRRELEEAIEGELVAEPISMTAILTSLAISAATAGASFLIQKAFTPKPKPQERGRQTGELVINVERGILIPEIYGRDPGDGYGGSWIAPTVGWTSGLRKHENVSRQEVGGGKGGGGRQTTETIEITYDMDLMLIWLNKGPYRLIRQKANADVIYDLYGAISTYEAEIATLTAPYQIVSYSAASQGKEATLQGSGGATSAVLFTSVLSNGTATRTLTIYYRTGSGISMPIAYSLNGGTEVNITLNPSPNDQSYTAHSIQLSLNDGLNTFKIRNRSTTFNLGIDKIYCYPGSASGTGVLDPTVPPDPSYNPITPIDPTLPYIVPVLRYDSVLDADSTMSLTGTLLHGGGQVAIYPGNDTQLPDPTMQAALDAQYGPDSTPAYHHRAITVDTGFYLTRWGNVFPNRTGLWEHDVIGTCAQLSDFMSRRVNILTADFDYSDIETQALRGIRITGRKFQPREPLTECAEFFNYYYAEVEGQLLARPRGTVTNAAISDADLGWIEGEDLPDNLSLVDVTEPDVNTIPVAYDVKYVDLDRDGEPNTQSDGRQTFDHQESKTLEVQITCTAEEGMAVAVRELYQADVEKPVRFTTDWSRIWWEIGSIVPITLANGFTYQIELRKRSGGIGVLEWEGVLIDTPVFVQPAVGVPGEFEVPPVPIPGMTICALLNLPIRDVDSTLNNGSLVYGAMRPMTTSGLTWTGASLYQKKGELGWERLADFNKPATMGRIVSARYITNTTTLFDNDGEFIIDLYGTDTLESLSTDDVLTGGNPASFGEMVGQYKDAVRVEDGSPNRWRVTGLLHGRQGTDNALWQDFTGKMFVVLNEAVKPVPINLSDINVEREYKAVTVGQSLDDAATLKFIYTGRSLRHPPPAHVKGTFDSDNDLLIELTRRVRIGNTFRDYLPSPLGDEEEFYYVQIKTLDGSSILPNGKERKLPVIVGMSQAAALITYGSNLDKFDYIDQSTMSVSGTDISVNGRAIQEITEAGNFVEATLKASGEGVAALELIDRDGNHKYYIGVNAGLSPDMVVQIDGGSLISVGDYTSDTEVRLRITVSGTEVRFYQDYADRSTPPLYTSSLAPTFPLIPACSAVSGSSGGGGGTASISKMILTTYPNPKTVYSKEQQEEDFGSVQDEVRVSVWQESSYAGPGEVTELILPTPKQIVIRPVYASFYQADSRTTLPELDTGEEWEILTGTLGTRRYMAYASALNGAGYAAAVVDKGVSDCRVGVTLREVATNNGHGLTLRATDANNRYILDVFPANTIRLFNMVGGVLGAAVQTWARTINERDLIEAEWKGDVLTIIHNGEKLSPTYTNSTRNTATKFGIHFGSTLVALKHFADNQEPVASEYVRVSSPQNFQGFQRNVYGLADIPITGTTDAVDGSSVEARFNGGPWATIDTVTSGAFSGTLTNQYMGEGVLEVRLVNNPDAIARVRYNKIGRAILGLGQSNMRGPVASPQSYMHASLRASVFDPNSEIWREAYDPTSGATPGANINSLWPILMGLLMSDGIPTSFINTGIGSTGLTNGQWAQGGGAYNACLATVADSDINSLEYLIFYQGETDAVNAGMTQSLYETALKLMRSDLSADLGFGELVMYVVQIGHLHDPSTTETRASVDAVRLAQSHAADTDQYIRLGACTYDLDITYSAHSVDPVWVANTAYIIGDTVRAFANGSPRWFEATVGGTSAATTASEPPWSDMEEGETIVDGTVTWTARGYASDGQHINRPDHGAIIAARLDRSIKTGDRGPRFAGATRISATELYLDFTLAEGHALANVALPHQGVRHTSSGGTLRTVSALTWISGTRLKVTSSTVVVGDKISFGSYNDATGYGVYDDGDTPLPIEPFVNQVVN